MVALVVDVVEVVVVEDRWAQSSASPEVPPEKKIQGLKNIKYR